MCFIDSQPRIFRHVYGFLYHRVKQLCTVLTWSTFNNAAGPNHIQFSRNYWTYNLPLQTNRNGCGFHTVLNAWIFALGLRPHPVTQCTNQDYLDIERFVQWAFDGVLDWRTLTDWLICRGLVVQNNLNQVPLGRRFLSTEQQQADLFALSQAIDDDRNAELKNGLPLDFETNVNFYPNARQFAANENDPHYDEQPAPGQAAGRPAAGSRLEIADTFDEDDSDGLGGHGGQPWVDGF